MAYKRLYNAGNGIQVDFKDRLSQRVYGGRIDREIVAVKKVDSNSSDWNRVKQEINYIRRIGNHRNIVEYKGYSETKQPPTFYIAMEKCCTKTLQNVVEQGDLPKDSHSVILQHIARGLQHIHENNIVHRKLKPKYILLSADCKNIKISEFGIGKEVEATLDDSVRTCEYLSVTIQRVGQWASKELYNQRFLTWKTDIFSAGLIFFFVLSEGKHLFGDNLVECVQNIKDGVSKEVKLPDAAAAHLVNQMISHIESERPAAEKILKHPYFWDDNTRTECASQIDAFSVESSRDVQSLGSEDKKNEIAMLYASFYWSQHNLEQLSQEVQTAIRQMITPVKYKELCNVHFDPEHGEKDSNKGKVQGIIQYESIQINVNRPLAEDKWVFECETTGPIEEVDAVKIVKFTEENLKSAQLFKKLQGETTILVPRREMDFECPDYNPPPGRDAACLPSPGKTYLYFVMEIGCKPLCDVLEENPSPEYRKMLALHVVYSLEATRAKNIGYKKISSTKFVLSNNKKYLKLIGSTAVVKESLNDGREDIAAVAEVLNFIVGVQKPQPWRNVFDHLLEKMKTGAITAEDIPCHPFFWESIKKLDFLEVVGNIYDARNNNSSFENYLKDCMDSDWSVILSLDEKEQELGFADDSQGIIFNKAREWKNKTTLKYNHASPIHLLRLIRNCAGHLLDDCANYKKKNGGDQKLFKTKEDIWIFFSKRYPTLLQKVYTYVQQHDGENARLTRFFKNKRPHKPLPVATIKKHENVTQ